MKMNLLSKIIALGITASMVLSALPMTAGAEGEPVSEVIPATNTVTLSDDTLETPNWENGVKGVQFGKTQIYMMRRPAYVYFKLHDIDAINKLSIRLEQNADGNINYIRKYSLTDSLPDAGSVASYGTDTEEYKEWNSFTENNMTALTTFIGCARNTETDITDLIKDSDKKEGYLLLEIHNWANRTTLFDNSALTVEYDSDKLAAKQEAYLDNINSAMSAQEMQSAMTDSAAAYFGVDKNALYDMSNVYKALVNMLNNETVFTKDSFKAAFDAEVEKNLETKELLLSDVANFEGSTSWSNNISDITKIDFNFDNGMGVSNRGMFIGGKIDNPKAVKRISFGAQGNDKVIVFTNAYLTDDFKTGDKQEYTSSDDSGLYTYWNNLNKNCWSEDVIGQRIPTQWYYESNKYLATSSTTFNTVDLSEYLVKKLNKYGDDKYLTLRLSGTSTVEWGVPDRSKTPRFIVTYDKTYIDSDKTKAWTQISEAMDSSAIKSAVEAYGKSLGIDCITKISSDFIYDELLAALDSCQTIDDFTSKALELYGKYTVTKSISPEIEKAYNANHNTWNDANGRIGNVQRMLSQFDRAQFGDANRILSASYKLKTSSINEYESGDAFVRTLSGAIMPDGENADTRVSGSVWQYLVNTQSVARISISGAESEKTADITVNLKDKLNVGTEKLTYTVGIEEQDGGAGFELQGNAYAAVEMVFDRTYRADEAMQALKAAEGVDVLEDYGIEFNVTDEQINKLDECSAAVQAEVLAELKKCSTVFEVETMLPELLANVKTTSIKFALANQQFADGAVSADVTKIANYDGSLKVIYASYKNGGLVKVYLTDNAELTAAEKGDTVKLSMTNDMGEHDTIKIMILNSMGELLPLAESVTIE